MQKNGHAFLYQSSDDHNDARKKRHATARINALITSFLKEFDRYAERRMAFEDLLTCVRSRTDLLKPISGKGWPDPVFLLLRLRNLAARQAHWIRSCEEWRPPIANLRPVFRSLALHLLGHYSVPAFLDSVWDLSLDAEGFRQQAWYIRLSRGASLRRLNLPLVITRNMEHYVRHAPDHFTVCQALRYGETRGLGGSEQLAHEIAKGQLGREIHHPAFWRTVLMFLVKHAELDLHQVNPVIDFIQHHKFPRYELLTEQGIVCRPAPWPDFSIEGRTPKSMLRLTSAWHDHLAQNKQGPNFSWEKSPIAGYCFEDKQDGEENPRVWTVRELLQRNELYAEGRALHHCVHAYADKCRNRETTIWSLRLRTQDGEKSMATIAVDPKTRRITEARAKCNLPLGSRSLEIIHQWAAWASLQCAFNM